MACSNCKVQNGDPGHNPDRFIVLGSKVYSHLYISVIIGQCKTCKHEYYVMEDPGYHTPQYHWYTDAKSIEMYTGESVDLIKRRN